MTLVNTAKKIGQEIGLRGCIAEPTLPGGIRGGKFEELAKNPGKAKR